MLVMYKIKNMVLQEIPLCSMVLIRLLQITFVYVSISPWAKHL